MKLFYCTTCHDVVALHYQIRECECGLSMGYYTDQLNAEIAGPCVPIGFHNTHFLAALENQPTNGPGRTFTAFVIEKNCPTIKWKP